MQEENLTHYLIARKVKDQLFGRALKFVIDRRIYHYGENFKNSFEEKSLLNRLKRKLKTRIIGLKMKLKKKSQLENVIVSSAYVSAHTMINYEKNKFIPAPWMYSLNNVTSIDASLFNSIVKLDEIMEKASLNELLSSKTQTEYEKCKHELEIYFSNKEIKGIILPHDIGFFEILSLEIFKKLKKPSFLYIHGIPAYYCKSLYSKSDFLLVWGEALKNHFIEAGFDANKIFVVGHPNYRPVGKKIISSLENVLVLGSSIPGGQLDEEKTILWDRGNSILYCLQIEETLKELGVKSVRFRPHPSENSDWYFNFLDKEFFVLDEEPGFSNSVSSSSMVIGPSSTGFIESLNLGVNYVTFEPFYNDGSYLRYKLVPPFDKSDNRLLVATNKEDLKNILKANAVCDTDIVKDYLAEDFTLESCIDRLIKNR